MPDRDDHSVESDEDEEECRVCRGPAEPGRPLVAPCKCSGSIGLVHQECLTQWLQITRGDGRCELCSYKFRFAPKYAEGAPERLPWREVVVGMASHSVSKWVPFFLRILLVFIIWLFIVPVVTSYCYHGWTHNVSSIPQRWHWDLVLGDAISGAVIAGFVIISFLSLMSFADYLRVNWPRPAERRPAFGGEDNLAREEENPPESDIDDVALDNEKYVRRQRKSRSFHPVGVMDERQPLFANSTNQARSPSSVDLDIALQDMPDDPVAQREELQRRIRAAMALRRHIDRIEAQDQMSLMGKGQDAIHDETHDDDNATENHIAQEEEKEVMDETDIDRFLRQQELADDEDDEDAIGVGNENEALPNLVPDDDVNEDNPGEPVFTDRFEPQFEPQGQEEQMENVENNMDETDIDRFLRQQELADDEDDEDNIGVGNENEALPNLVPDDDANEDNAGEPVFPDRFEPQFEPLDPVQNPQDQEEQMENVENIAFDEMFGLRGPIGGLLKNFLWLLLFNLVYLGFFVFIPRCLGKVSFALLLNHTSVSNFANSIPYYNETDGVGLVQLGEAFHSETQRMKGTLQVPDLLIVALGYISFGALICAIQWVLIARKKIVDRTRQNVDIVSDNNIHIVNDGQPVLRVPLNDRLDPDQEEQPPNGTIIVAFEQVIDCGAAVVKVFALLFLKMILLPLLLGIWLDVATAAAFGTTLLQRVHNAGSDVFASALLHWVFGITFMLLVTVSVLQLREVVHPALLGPIIRPQEPQPDLLGNLLHENGVTHAKRMMLSFSIYAVLLLIHVWLPAWLASMMNMASAIPFFDPKLCYLLPPKLQIPLEMLCFHLTMLSFLEKYKNKIGETQHAWLKFICRVFGLTDKVLPRRISKFEYVGQRPVFVPKEELGSDVMVEDALTTTTSSSAASDSFLSEQSGQTSKPFSTTLPTTLKHGRDLHEVDTFWYDLAAKPSNIVEFIESGVEKSKGKTVAEDPHTKANGQKVLCDSKGYIRLPLPVEESTTRKRQRASPTKSSNRKGKPQEIKNIIATTQGPFRLRRETRTDGEIVIHVWREVAGDIINRPPEGWDDLGVGGAQIQGRWAWAKEPKSAIENEVAYREPWVQQGQGFSTVMSLVVKGIFITLASWVAITFLICAGLSSPLIIGRIVFYLLRIPEAYVHDPAAMGIGLVVISPLLVLLSTVSRTAHTSWEGLQASLRRCPSLGKKLALLNALGIWLLQIPILLGIAYELFFVSDSLKVVFSVTNMARIMGCGTLVYNVVAAMCIYKAFTVRFWVRLFHSFFEENDNAVANNDDDEDESEYVWQGKQGRFAVFLDNCSKVFIHGDWTEIGQVNVAGMINPIRNTLLHVLLIPISAFKLFAWTIMKEESLVGFRSVMLFVMATEMVICCRPYMRSWFEVVHKAARDDRYLVGEVLLNHGQVQEGGGR